MRSCYQTSMRFFVDDPLEIDVRWYFCDVNAKALPFPTPFGSGNWASSRVGWSGVGEVEDAAREWVDGSKPPFDGTVLPGYDGKKFAGPAAGFTEGTKYPGVPLECKANGLCPACGPIPLTCLEWAALHSDMTLRITNVSTHSPFQVGNVGDTINLHRFSLIDCQYQNSAIPLPLLSDIYSADWQYDTVGPLFHVMRAFHGTLDLPADSVQVFPTFKAFYNNVPMYVVFDSAYYPDEIWDFVIET